MLKERDRPPISEELDQIINGYLMGDGYLKPSGALQVEQGKNQHKFVLWMFNRLQDFCTETCQVQPILEPPRSPRAGKVRSYRFTTRAWFKDYYKVWYRPDKRLPDNILTMFTPLFITVWFACDGTKTIGSRGAKFEVTMFTAEERLVLKTLFQEKYQIKAGIIPQGNSQSGTTQWALCINAGDYDKFYALITKDNLIPTLFPYKLCRSKT